MHTPIDPQKIDANIDVSTNNVVQRMSTSLVLNNFLTFNIYLLTHDFIYYDGQRVVTDFHYPIARSMPNRKYRDSDRVKIG